MPDKYQCIKIYAPNSFNIVSCFVLLAYEYVRKLMLKEAKSSSVDAKVASPPHTVCSLCPLSRAAERLAESC